MQWITFLLITVCCAMTLACRPLEASEIVDINIYPNELCGSECAAVWNSNATAQDCLLWSEKAWWTGSACVVKCEDLNGYTTTRDPMGDAHCTPIQGTELNYYVGKSTAHQGLNSIPIWCACYDAYKFIRYTDRGFCQTALKALLGFQWTFIAVGAIGIAGLIYECLNNSSRMYFEEYRDKKAKRIGGSILFCALLIILSSFAIYLAPIIFFSIIAGGCIATGKKEDNEDIGHQIPSQLPLPQITAEDLPKNTVP